MQIAFINNFNRITKSNTKFVITLKEINVVLNVKRNLTTLLKKEI